PKPVVRVHDATGERGDVVLDGHDARLTALEFGPDGECLATADSRGRGLVWDAPDWRRRVLPALQAPGPLLALSISPSRRLIAGAGPEEISVWDLAQGLKVLVLQGAPPGAKSEFTQTRVTW